MSICAGMSLGMRLMCCSAIILEEPLSLLYLLDCRQSRGELKRVTKTIHQQCPKKGVASRLKGIATKHSRKEDEIWQRRSPAFKLQPTWLLQYRRYVSLLGYSKIVDSKIRPLIA